MSTIKSIVLPNDGGLLEFLQLEADRGIRCLQGMCYLILESGAFEITSFDGTVLEIDLNNGLGLNNLPECYQQKKSICFIRSNKFCIATGEKQGCEIMLYYPLICKKGGEQDLIPSYQYSNLTS
jgi:hypothetical protein